MVITLRRLDLFPMFLMLALISIASYGDSDDDFDNDAEIEERMEQRSEDSEEDWEEDHYDTEDAEEEIEAVSYTHLRAHET